MICISSTFKVTDDLERNNNNNNNKQILIKRKLQQYALCAVQIDKIYITEYYRYL